MSNADTEQSRFGDKAAQASSLEAGSVAWRDGTQPVLVVSVTEAEGDDPGAGNAAVQVAALDIETVHVDDLATEYVDPADVAAGQPGATAAPLPAPGAESVAVVTPQPPADDAARQTTPTGTAVAGGTATVDAAAAQAAAEGAVDTTNPPPSADTAAADREAAQDQRIADLEAQLAEARRGTTPSQTPSEPIGP